MSQTHNVTIGCGSSCGSCRIEEAARLIDSGEVDYLAFDRLAERTTSEMLGALSSGADAFCPELDLYTRELTGRAIDNNVRLITNAGGEDPAGALKTSLEGLREQGVKARLAALVPKTDVLAAVKKVNPILVETGRPLSELKGEVLGASTYYSSKGITRALEAGADMVITGRVGDSALYMAPLAHEFGWAWDDWDRLARGMAVGHLLECGPHLTGGYYAAPPRKIVPDLERVGLPFAHVDADGNATFTKLESTGGKVTLPIVREQMLYEVGDPRNYMHTDVVVDFSQANPYEVGHDQVRVENVIGHPAPDTLKVLISVREGYMAESYVSFGGSDAYDRAKFSAELVRKRIAVMGLDVRGFEANFLGVNSLFTKWGESPVVPREVHLHLAGRFGTREDAARFISDCFMGAGSHYGPQGGAVGRTMMPVEDMPSVYSAYIDRSLIEDPELVLEEA